MDMDTSKISELMGAINDAQYEKQVAEMKLAEAKQALLEQVIESKMWFCVSLNMPAIHRFIRRSK